MTAEHHKSTGTLLPAKSTQITGRRCPSRGQLSSESTRPQSAHWVAPGLRPEDPPQRSAALPRYTDTRRATNGFRFRYKCRMRKVPPLLAAKIRAARLRQGVPASAATAVQQQTASTTSSYSQRVGGSRVMQKEKQRQKQSDERQPVQTAKEAAMR